MCGIYGTTRSYSKEIFEKKMGRIKFRFPNLSGFHNIDGITFCHSNISIVDINSRSNHCLFYQRLFITFDGEIYNYKSLIKELEAKGHSITTKSDTEAICAAYLAYGTDCVSKLNGSFSFAIYDTVTKIIFGARDRLGNKPFYYSINDGFEFSSHSSAIKIGRYDIRVDNENIQKYLLFGHIPEPNSIYKEIKKLPPGTSFVYNTVSNQFTSSIFWNIFDTKSVSYSKSYSEAQTELHTLLDDTVKLCLQSGVSIGTFLSGGIDSTLMTALCKKHNNSIEAFSIGFPGSNMDESQDAKKVAKHLGVKHTIIDCNPKEALELIDDFTKYYDEPFADSSAIPSMLLCQKVKPYATVAISGDGGDESFIGYKRTKWIHQVLPIYKIPQHLRTVLAAMIAQLPGYRLKLIAQGLRHERIEDLILSLLSSQFFFSKKTITELSDYQTLIKHTDIPLFQRMADLDLHFYLLNDCNVKVERAAAYAGIQVRSPLLDFRVVEFARNLPVAYRYKKGVQKRILKDILYTYVPEKLMDKPKSGFAIPLKDWFRYELKDYVYDVLSNDNLGRIPFIDKEMIRKNIQLHMMNRLNFSLEIWKLIVLIKWLQENE